MLWGIALLIAAGISWTVIGIVISQAASQKLNLDRIQADSAFVCLLVSGMFLILPLPSGGTLPSLLVGGVLVIAGITNFFTFSLMNLAMQRGKHGIIWSLVQSALVCPFLMGFGCLMSYVPRFGWSD